MTKRETEDDDVDVQVPDGHKLWTHLVHVLRKSPEVAIMAIIAYLLVEAWDLIEHLILGAGGR